MNANSRTKESPDCNQLHWKSLKSLTADQYTVESEGRRDFKLFSINALKHSNDTKRQQYFAWFNCAWFFFRGKLLVHSPLWIFSLYVLVSWWRWNCCTMWKRIHMRGEKKSQFFACNVECFRFYFFFILLFDPSHALVTGFWRTTAVKKLFYCDEHEQ